MSKHAVAALRARPTLAAAVLYAVVALAFVAPALVPGRVMSHSQALWFAPPWSSERPTSVETAGNLWLMSRSDTR